MKIGILETGLVREELADRHDPYPVMFERLLGLAERKLEFATFSVLRGEMPESIDDCDGWLITGSRYGVYEKLDWMLVLQDFIRELAAAGRPLIGVCFGHQIIAEALGGKVVKSELGWKVGVQRYDLERRYDWMGESPSSVAMHAYHQDQIVECPPEAEVFLSSADCPLAGLSYGDSIISVQAHPEIEESYERDLLELFAGRSLPLDLAQQGIASLDAGIPVDTRLVANWFVEFFLTREMTAQAAPLEQSQA
ncbi:MAG: type 1 glutamine amidotransferase [Gammaproteobacteria bacterium]|nr:type 1 glutamine amidotransferase [Gammaproteobacteria bacterium]